MYNIDLPEMCSGTHYVYIDSEGNHVDTLAPRNDVHAMAERWGIREGCRVYRVTVTPVC